MKFQLGQHLLVDTSDRWRPVKMSSTLTNLFYAALSALHCIQAFRYRGSLWLVYHGINAALAAYWPYMIFKGWAHKELGHETYGFLTSVPHVTPLQVFGSLMVLDKVINWNSLTWGKREGEKLIKRDEPLNAYGIDNLFMDNKVTPKLFTALAVNIPYIVALSLIEFFVPAAGSWVKWGSLLMGALAGGLIWVNKYKGK